MNDPFEAARTEFFAGLARQQAGDFAEAERRYRASLALVPGRASTLINLAAVQLRQARPRDALASADAALAVERDSSDALLHRATALAQLGRADDALVAFRRLLAIDPHHATAWSSLGTLLRETGRLDDAAHAFREAMRHGADAGLHEFYLASVESRAVPAPPRAYVAGLFDGYADDFDAHVVGALRYRGHRRLVERLVALGDARYESAVDLGCGTGLCGPLVRPLAHRLTGVDLSERMLAKARALGVYDRLAHADIVDFLDATTDEQFDLVLAADVFIYVGDLEPTFARLQRAMSRGVLCFSVEALADDAGADLRLLPSLRYAHSPAYVRRMASDHGFATIATERAAVREDQGQAVEGLYVYLRRKPEGPG